MIKNTIQWGLNLFYPLFKKFLSFQVYAYLAVGAANTIFNIVLFFVFYFLLISAENFYSLGINLSTLAVEIATFFSFLISVLTGFWLSKNFAFTNSSNQKREKTKQFGKYFLVSLQGQFSDYLITKGLVIFLHTEPRLAYCISTIIMLILNYSLQKHYTFKAKKENVNG